MNEYKFAICLAGTGGRSGYTVANNPTDASRHMTVCGNVLKEVILPPKTILLFYGTFGLTQKYPKGQENIWRNFAQATP